jgi:hypothetical protein
MATMANKDNNPTFKEAMAGPDAGGFITAMEAEVLSRSKQQYESPI